MRQEITLWIYSLQKSQQPYSKFWLLVLRFASLVSAGSSLPRVDRLLLATITLLPFVVTFATI